MLATQCDYFMFVLYDSVLSRLVARGGHQSVEGRLKLLTVVALIFLDPAFKPPFSVLLEADTLKRSL